MVAKKTNYTKGITYIDAINMFNDLNDVLGADGFYRFQETLTDMKGNSVPGFSYKGYTAGRGLGKILNDLKIEYVINIKSGTGVNEEAEILIKPEYIDRMMDIYNKIGMMQSRQRVDINHKLEKQNYSLDQVITR